MQSSTNVINHRIPDWELIGVGPQTSKWINSKGFVLLFKFTRYEVRWLLAKMQTLHIREELGSRMSSKREGNNFFK
jgi:hypothetical protein